MNLSRVSQHFRRRRMAAFARRMSITAATRVLDIGGTPDCWDLVEIRPRVTLVNMPRAGEAMKAQWVAGDGCALPFADGAFDVVFSNSVIEHVGDLDRQRRFAAEVRRVGRTYWVQTPNRWFPVEQHLLTPLVHWLPKPWQERLVPRWNLWSVLVSATPDQRQFYMEHYLRDVRLLGARDLRLLFPGARILRERFCGWTKSLIAVGG
ncbi:MAG: class I SAM-dependent methyltransferase [Bryobacteraceae bacterium]